MSSFSRRNFLGTAAATVGLSTLIRPALAQGDVPSPTKPKNINNPYVYHFKIGEIDAWSISDAHMLFNDRVDKM